ncbi:MAG: (deoxy)nucleoside triphosphate pyrophosphohydrolase [Clostridium perfringens]|nr:(deoxy)nucleoside triphosphate pyrophosphohydrolase [Clostridium perfringens]
MINVVAAILEKEDKILIAKKREGKSLAGYWEFPGGKIENGETSEEALVRELKEEMDIEVEVNRYVGESIYDYGNNKIISLKGHTAKIIGGEIKLTDHDEYRWVTLKEIKGYKIAPADIPLINFIDK